FGCVTKFDWLNNCSIPYRQYFHGAKISFKPAENRLDSEICPEFSLLQKDMESLRYEISWKDERIEYLQRTLTELENSMPCSSADN
uniref:Myotubularin phosphatase domain-containing protein n=1 Tax=Angiostrongylus cantonensis TaxID=6313 RepID=A0A0K0DI25_ANGCA